MQIDASPLARVLSAIAEDARQVGVQARPVMSKAGVELKKKMVEDARRSRHFPIAASINYDLSAGKQREIDLEVGPDKTWKKKPDKNAGPAGTANIAYFGGANGGGNTIPDPEPHLDAEAAVVEEFLGDLLEGLGD